MADIFAADYGSIRTPTTDGYFIPDDPSKLLQRMYIKRTEILIGGVINEGKNYRSLDDLSNFQLK